jgi:hypothetical protein
MRTTLDIADDVLAEARFIAQRDNTSMGAVISQWAREAVTGLHTSVKEQAAATATSAPMTYEEARAKCALLGFVPIFTGGVPGSVTNELINRIREEEGI